MLNNLNQLLHSFNRLLLQLQILQKQKPEMLCFIRKIHWAGRGQETEDKETSPHPPTHKGCVYSVTILISKEEITVLSFQKNKGEKAEALEVLPLPHLAMGRGLLGKQGVAADFREGKDTN